MRDVPIKMRKIIVKFWKCCEIFARELIQFAVVSQNSVIILCAALPRSGRYFGRSEYGQQARH